MRNKTYLFVTFVLVLTLALAACGGGEEPSTGAGGADAKAGEELYAQTVIGAQPGCITCHSLEAGVVVVGPSMAGIAVRGGTTVDGQSLEEYLEASILNPDEYLVEGYAAGTMPQVWEDELTDQQVKNLVAYLQTLK